MKFRVKFHESKWNGRTCSTGRVVKQKTFNADNWDEAEDIERAVANDLYQKTGYWYESSLTVLK